MLALNDKTKQLAEQGKIKMVLNEDILKILVDWYNIMIMGNS